MFSVACDDLSVTFRIMMHDNYKFRNILITDFFSCVSA